jgi:DNA repair exonuclease SbcCD ATPase subunit
MNTMTMAGRLCATGTLVLLSVCSASAQDRGVKQLEKVVTRAGTAVQVIVETQLQLTKTVDVYNALMAQDAKDRKALYKKLQSELAATEKKRSEIRMRSDELRGESEILFQSWTDSLKAIESADLRKRSEERQTKMRASLSDIEAAGKKALEIYVPVMKTLQDHVAYLGHDLTAPAVASLEADAAKLNEQVKGLSKRIDETVVVANGTIATMRP